MAAFDPADYWFLEALIKKAVQAVVDAVKEVGEEAVFKYVRLIAAIVCPDHDRHPDIIKYCLWPLLSGPLKKMIEDAVVEEMNVWLRNSYPVLPAFDDAHTCSISTTGSGQWSSSTTA